MSNVQKPNGRGGRREGAGRPPGSFGPYKRVRELAQARSKEALATLVDLMCNDENPWVRLKSADAIFDLGYGKPRYQDTVEQQERLAVPYESLDEIRAQLIAAGIPIDDLLAPKRDPKT